jgi:hypothetical protein
MNATVDYYQKIVYIAKDILGPAAERFVARQVDFHLGKKPEHLEKEDVSKLAERMRSALELLSADKKSVDDTVAKILQVTK